MRTVYLIIAYVLMPFMGFFLMRHQSSLGLLLGLVLLVSFAILTRTIYRSLRKSLTQRKRQV